jgi:hypothetical protein
MFNCFRASDSVTKKLIKASDGKANYLQGSFFALEPNEYSDVILPPGYEELPADKLKKVKSDFVITIEAEHMRRKLDRSTSISDWRTYKRTNFAHLDWNPEQPNDKPNYTLGPGGLVNGVVQGFGYNEDTMNMIRDTIIDFKQVQGVQSVRSQRVDFSRELLYWAEQNPSQLTATLMQEFACMEILRAANSEYYQKLFPEGQFDEILREREFHATVKQGATTDESSKGEVASSSV